MSAKLTQDPWTKRTGPIWLGGFGSGGKKPGKGDGNEHHPKRHGATMAITSAVATTTLLSIQAGNLLHCRPRTARKARTGEWDVARTHWTTHDGPTEGK